MKKALITVFCAAVIIVAAILMWKFLFPFIGFVLEKILEVLTAIFS